MVENCIHMPGLAVRGEPHQFVFPRIHLETCVVRESRIQHPQRVWESHFMTERNPVSTPDPDRAGSPFPDRIQSQDSSLFERGGEERTRGMGLVMIHKRGFVAKCT